MHVQLHLTLCDLIDKGSSLHGISQARVLEWVLPLTTLGELPDPGIEPVSLTFPALAGRFLPTAPPGKQRRYKQCGNERWKIPMCDSVHLSSVTQSYPTLCDPMNHSMPGLPVHHQLPEFTQTHVHRVGDAIQPSHPLSAASPPVPNPSQHQGLFQWVNSSNQVAKVLEFQLQHQSFQWTPRTDLL